jgi:hypothetical protein
MCTGCALCAYKTAALLPNQLTRVLDLNVLFCLQVVAGRMPQYDCYDLVLLQDLSSKLERLGCEPLSGGCECIAPGL